MSKTQIEKTAQRGGNLFSTVLSLARPLMMPAAKAAAKALATAGLSFGVERALKKIFGEGFGPREIELYKLVQRLSPQAKGKCGKTSCWERNGPQRWHSAIWRVPWNAGFYQIPLRD